MTRTQVPSEERVFSLVLALLASTQGLTKHDLLSSVYGYSDRYQDQTQRLALDRQFERDKALLRNLGIRVDTIDAPGEPGNNQLSRYRISKEAFEVPSGLEFSERELMLLRMAVLAWREGSLTDDVRRASMKVESLGGGNAVDVVGMSAGFGAAEPSAPALLAAIEAKQVAEFDYLMPEREVPLSRRVLPLQLHRFEGRWHVIALDLDRDAPRVFLLSRIAGPVMHRVARTDEPNWPDAVGDMIAQTAAELHALQQQQRISVRVRPQSIAAIQLASRADAEANPSGDVVTIGTTDVREIASHLAGFGADVEVLEPATVRNQVQAILQRVARAHAGVREGSEDG